MKRTRYFLLMMFLYGSLAWAQKEARELAHSNWGVDVEPSVVAKAFSKEAVRDFMGAFSRSISSRITLIEPEMHEFKIDELDWSEVYDLRQRLPGALGTVGAFKWADVDGDGFYELLVTMDYSGRAFYNNFSAIKQIAGAYRKQDIDIRSSDEFREFPGSSTSILDLDHDGTQELILNVEMGSSRGASLSPDWPSIYKWKKYRFVKADEQFKSFYEGLLPGIESVIERLSRNKSEEEQDLDEELSLEWLIRDKIIRFLGRDPQAGLQRATRWAKSANANVRENADIVLKEILGKGAVSENEARDIASSDWGVNAEPSIKKKPFSQDAVRDLIGAFAYGVSSRTRSLGRDVLEVKIDDLAWSEVREINSTFPWTLGWIGALKWADVDADGAYELLVTMNFRGPDDCPIVTTFYDRLLIMKQVTGGYRMQTIRVDPKGPSETFSESLHDLRHSPGSVALSDLDHDGTLELVLPIDLEYSDAVWRSFYKWEKDGYIEADRQFKDLYEQILLPESEARIAALSKGKSEAEQELDEELLCEWVVRDKIVRLLGKDPQAGFQRAIIWAKSASSNVREYAALVFDEIPGEESARYLEELAAEDKDCYYAQEIMKKRRYEAQE